MRDLVEFRAYELLTSFWLTGFVFHDILKLYTCIYTRTHTRTHTYTRLSKINSWLFISSLLPFVLRYACLMLITWFILSTLFTIVYSMQLMHITRHFWCIDICCLFSLHLIEFYLYFDDILKRYQKHNGIILFQLFSNWSTSIVGVTVFQMLLDMF